jgi:hypothetical protein
MDCSLTLSVEPNQIDTVGLGLECSVLCIAECKATKEEEKSSHEYLTLMPRGRGQQSGKANIVISQ